MSEEQPHESDREEPISDRSPASGNGADTTCDGQTTSGPGYDTSSETSAEERSEEIGDDESVSLKDIRPGKKDGRGREVLELLWAVEDFKIYKTAKGINPHFADGTDKARGQLQQYLKLGEELAQLNHLIHLQSLRSWRFTWRNEKPGFNPSDAYYERELARGIADALTGQPDRGKTTLAALSCRLEKRLRNKGRMINFGMCFVTTIVIVSIATLLLADPIGIDLEELALAAIMGSVGALLSTAVGLKNLKIDTGASLVMNWVYGGQRMLVGVLGAGVLYLALRAGVATEMIPGLSDAPAAGALPGEPQPLEPYKLAFVSVLAGFSERLVPNLLDRNGDNAERPQPPAAPSGAQGAG
ncbi:hypothetical protein [Pelagibius sp.]|uniref:hypothetical protein n=1 Tax=Pelagibius sp. TaxID=1931238 RepID=UPI00260F2B98|nr:hypothetical protein [Pelagibius sp.]